MGNRKVQDATGIPYFADVHLTMSQAVAGSYLRERALRIASLSLPSGRPQYMRRSSLPGRNRAASSRSGREVAAMTTTPTHLQTSVKV
jgi:hypothetical protein